MFKSILKYIIEFWKEDCPYCKNKKCASFYYEDHFHTKKNIYKCEKCKTEFIGL